jgi:hypothetical protein
LRIVSQRVTLNDNEIVVGWSGAAPSYRVEIGSGVNRSDVRSVDVTTTSYAFVAPRTANAYYARVVASDGERISAPTSELTIVTLDLRHIIDALFFRSGPMSEGHAIQPGNIRAGVWPDGTHLRVLVSHEAGERIRSLAQAAVDDYASVVGGAVTGNAELVSDDMHSLTRAEQLAPFTIATRILKGQCGNGCANYGPAPLGPNASIVTLDSAAVTRTVAHELGHAYGLAHVLNPDSDRPEFRFLMHLIAGGPNFTETEKTAIAAARAGGIRAGTTRDEALARDLVLPYFGGGASVLPARRLSGGGRSTFTDLLPLRGTSQHSSRDGQ